MIIMTRVTSEGAEVKMAVNIANVIGANNADDGKVWVKYWDGVEVRSAKVLETLEELQEQMRAQRNGAPF